MYKFPSPGPDSCWAIALAALTGIEPNMFYFRIRPPYNVITPMIPSVVRGVHDVDAPLCSKEWEGTQAWRDLFRLNGYSMTFSKRRPKVPHVLAMCIYQPYGKFSLWTWVGHVAAVDENGIIYDPDSPLDGVPEQDILDDKWCNIALVSKPFITIREKPDGSVQAA